MEISPEKLLDLRLKYLEMIQAAISRMAANSASSKNFCITLVTATAGFSISLHQRNILFISFLPIVLFASMDAKYLLLERGFRMKYDQVISEELDSRPSLDMSSSSISVLDLLRSIVSWSVSVFYGIIALCIFLVDWLSDGASFSK